MRSVLPNRVVFADNDLAKLAAHVKHFSLRNFPGISPEAIWPTVGKNLQMEFLRLENLNTEHSKFVNLIRNAMENEPKVFQNLK
jgi:hypothetical protein